MGREKYKKKGVLFYLSNQRLILKGHILGHISRTLCLDLLVSKDETNKQQLNNVHSLSSQLVFPPARANFLKFNWNILLRFWRFFLLFLQYLNFHFFPPPHYSTLYNIPLTNSTHKFYLGSIIVVPIENMRILSRNKALYRNVK